MIIERKYATYGQLSADKATKEAILQVFQQYEVSKRVQDYILDPYNDIIVFNTDMGSGIPGHVFHELCQVFEKLDQTDPFDNNLTYRDVTDSYFLKSRRGAALLQILYRKKADLPTVIVQVIALEYNDGKTSIIAPWKIDKQIIL